MSGFLRMLYLYQRVGSLWSWATMIKPLVSALRPASLAIFGSCLGPRQPVSPVVGICLSALLIPTLDLSCWRPWCLAFAFVLRGIGGVRLILCSWYCGHSQFPTELHWLPVDGVQGFTVVRVFDKVEESVLRLLEVFIKTDSGWLVGKLQLYEPSTSFSMGRYNLSTSDLRWCILYMVRNFIVFVWSLASSCNVQFMMLRQQVTTGTAKVLMASSLFAEFSSDLRLIIIIILFMVKKCPFGRHYVLCSDYIIMPKIVQA